MKLWKKMLMSLMCSGIIMSGTIPMSASAAEVVDQQTITQQGIKQVIGIADVYGDGEKVTAAILQYPKEINPKSISIDDFKVDGKTIESVYVSDKPELTSKNKSGSYVILNFKYQNTAYDGDLSKRNPPKDFQDKNQGKNQGGKDAPMRSDRKLPNLSFDVQQVGTVEAIDGTIYKPNNQPVKSSSTQAPIINKFKQLVYTDKKGVSIPYNLYLPEKFNAKKKYPLLLFIPDASANINEVTTPLFQGNGATIWATPEEQAKHECIILAPQYTADLVEKLGMMTTDENVWTPGLTLVSNLLFDVIDKYKVDRNRIYGTGQSQGGMANIAISDKYPSLFAAQYLVACQWNIDEMEALKDKKLWITVCEGDTKAFPEMNKAFDRWKSLGSNAIRNEEFWDSKAPISDIDKQVKLMIKQNASINYTVFSGGNHMYTWSFAYNIDAIRDWLFSQTQLVVKKRGLLVPNRPM